MNMTAQCVQVTDRHRGQCWCSLLSTLETGERRRGSLQGLEETGPSLSLQMPKKGQFAAAQSAEIAGKLLLCYFSFVETAAMN